jgi:hypothetical protein
MEAIASLGQSGWPVDLLLLTTVSRINKVENLSFSPVPPPGEIGRSREDREIFEKYQDFKRVIELFLILLDSEILEVQLSTDKSKSLELIIDKGLPPEYRALEAEFRTTLGLDPMQNRFHITSRATELKPDEISIRTRSLLATMLFLSKGVDVPSADVTEGHVFPTSTDRENAKELVVPMHVWTARTPPKAAFVAIQYKGNWFYIDDSDLQSKRMFTLLMFLFELQAPAGGGAAPLITLPTG